MVRLIHTVPHIRINAMGISIRHFTLYMYGSQGLACSQSASACTFTMRPPRSIAPLRSIPVVDMTLQRQSNEIASAVPLCCSKLPPTPSTCSDRRPRHRARLVARRPQHRARLVARRPQHRAKLVARRPQHRAKLVVRQTTEPNWW